jgi:hypothetical protein
MRVVPLASRPPFTAIGVPQPLEGTNANLFWGRVSLKSLGAESDAFLAALRSLYGFPPSPSPMKAAIEFTAAGLGDDPRAVASQPVKIKLFYEPAGSESEGAEVYLKHRCHQVLGGIQRKGRRVSRASPRRPHCRIVGAS